MYYCNLCNYKTTDHSNYKKHLITKKHRRKTNECNEKQRMNTNEHKMNTNEHKMNTNEHKMNTNNQNEKLNNYICNNCGMTFNTKPSMRRHQLHYCKKVESNLEDELQKERAEKKKLYKQIERLLEDNGTVMNNIQNITNTTINQTNNLTNNIVINNYGDEDLSHITSSVLDKLITAPGDMINNLTKMIHFNKNKPENMNMYIPSRKQKFIKVFRKNKWMLEKKHERIPDIVDRNYNILDSYYEENRASDKLSKDKNKHYLQYQRLIDEKNEKVIKQEYDACELEILNNSEKVIGQHKLNN